MKRLIVTFVFIVICFLMQTTVLQGIRLAGVVPNLMLVITAFSGYINGRNAGIATGMITGLLIDCQYGTVIGAYALIYMLVGYGNGFCNRLYYRDDYTMPIILICLSELFYGIMTYGMQFLLRGRIDFIYYFGKLIMPELIYTLVFSIVVYKLILWIYNIIERPDKEAI